MADQLFWLTGLIVWSVIALTVLGFAILATAKLFNRASWALVECYDGVKTFNEFRRWYHTERPKPGSSKPPVQGSGQ
jgi:hypothetical protein